MTWNHKVGERMPLSWALRRVAVPLKNGDESRQSLVSVPRAIARLMTAESHHWRWRLVEDGVLLVPVAADQVAQYPGNALQLDYTGDVDAELPEWAHRLSDSLPL